MGKWGGEGSALEVHGASSTCWMTHVVGGGVCWPKKMKEEEKKKRKKRKEEEEKKERGKRVKDKWEMKR